MQYSLPEVTNQVTQTWKKYEDVQERKEEDKDGVPVLLNDFFPIKKGRRTLTAQMSA